MYYLNQTPAETPPSNLGRRTAPSWSLVIGGRSYSWHDGRLHALDTVALPSGASYVGRRGIPLRVDGQAVSVSGGVWHAGHPSIVWLWPILVLLACTLAASRVRRSRLDVQVARALSIGALIAISIAALARSLHGRPSVTVLQWITLAITFAFVACALRRMLFRRPGYFTYFVIAFVAIWEGAELAQTLFDGFVLAALPAFVARAASVLGLGCGASLLILVLRLADEARPRTAETPDMTAEKEEPARGQCEERLRRRWIRPGPLIKLPGALCSAVLLAGCSASAQPDTGTIPRDLKLQARPIGRGPGFHLPATGRVLGPCRPRLGPRSGVHVEVFAENRVVLVASGIGTRPPRRLSSGRISSAGCYGDLVTLEPTGVVLVRPGARLTLAALFRSWGQPLSPARLAVFPAPPGLPVTVFVNARRWTGVPGNVPLRRHAEIVVEVGPRVPPHTSYTFPPGT